MDNPFFNVLLPGEIPCFLFRFQSGGNLTMRCIISILVACGLLSGTMISMAQTGAVQGIVTDEKQRPIAWAVVYASQAYGTSVDTSGHYTIHGIPQGSWVLYAKAIGYKRATQTIVIFADSSVTADFVMREEYFKGDIIEPPKLPRQDSSGHVPRDSLTIGLAWTGTGMVRGHVIDDEWEKPVLGAIVEMSLARKSTVILEQGSFAFDSLSPGSDTLHVRALAYYDFILPVLIKPDTITTVDLIMTVVTFNHESGRTFPPPYHYVKRQSTVTYSPRPR